MMDGRPPARLFSCGLVFFAILGAVAAAADAPPLNKIRSTYYPAQLIRQAQANAAKHDWALAMQKELMDRAEPWLSASDDQLWDLMFGPNIPRSWHVWSDGYCPACKKDVRMYEWVADPWAHPWKMQCPHCKELFPKNDFEAYHRSGYDEHGVFHPERADRSLLFNTEHPDPADPLHLFGVDDGEGYVADGHRWRFIGAYVIYGQWKKWVHAGIVNLAAAHAASGEPRYALKAAILLDRVGDLFHTFDFKTQGNWVYEQQLGSAGQISVWHDACEEVRELAYAYDQIFEAAKSQEPALTAYLSEKARAHKLANPKETWADIQRNIESHIFRHTLEHNDQIFSNYPRREITNIVMKTVLDWPSNREEVMAELDALIEKATAVDGVSGEKGLAGYSTIAPRAVAEILSRLARLEPELLATVFERHPSLRETWRFHIDTWCMEEWYPRSGDTGAFGRKSPEYGGAVFAANPGVDPSMFTFFWKLHELTGDPAYVQVLYRANGLRIDGLPHDLFAEDPESFQRNVQAVIDREGTAFKLGSVNKQEWCLAVLRSGEGEHRRALWLDYDSGGGHGHADGMNMGLFALGLDLVPDFGYPPVGYGGWGGERAVWYKKSAAHATVIVDDKDLKDAQGKTTLWADGERFHAVRASAPAMIDGEQYERTLALIDLDEANFYVVDCFRVKGGATHTKFFGSFFGNIWTSKLNMGSCDPFMPGTQTRKYFLDEAPRGSWMAGWHVVDLYEYLPPGRQVELTYRDFTDNAKVYICEAWVDTGIYGGNGHWIPRIAVRRTGETAPLSSTFVSVVQAWSGDPGIDSVRRLSAEAENAGIDSGGLVALALSKTDGRTHITLLAPPGAGAVRVSEHDIQFAGELAHVVLKGGDVEYVAMAHANRIEVGPFRHEVGPNGYGFSELAVESAQVRVLRERQANLEGAFPRHDATFAAPAPGQR